MLLLGYVACITMWARQEASKHVCTGVEVMVEGQPGLDSIIRKGVYAELEKYPDRIKNSPLHQINTDAIEKYLSKYGNFESVNCMISARGELVVKIVPLIPVMRVFTAGGSYYINKEGKHIASNAEFFSDVPVVCGNFSKAFPPRDVLPLVNFVNKDVMLSELVSMIVAENNHNLILVPRIRGHVVNFGDTTRLKEKRKALQMFYNQVMPYKGWEEYDTISVKYRGQVVATRRDKNRQIHGEEYEEDIDPEEGTLPGVVTNESQNAKPDSTKMSQPQKPNQ